MEYRSIFISDVHLGTYGCQADKLCEFLKENECENLYLVGDIIDGWRLRKRWFWPQEHTNVVRRIFTKAKRGTNVFYITGNHDEFLRTWTSDGPMNFGNIQILDNLEYNAINGKRYFIVHGDMFDSLMNSGKWLMFIGDAVYEKLILLNSFINKIRKFFGYPYWSFSKFLKENTKSAVKFVQKYEKLIIDYCRKNDYDGIICGHIHVPKVEKIEDFDYLNCGDWVENCTALVETVDGEWKIVQ